MTSHYDNTTICATATAPGGAIGIIRVSGEKAIDITDSIFSPAGKGLPLASRRAGTITFGNVMDGTTVVDEVLVSLFHAPHSYTGEHTTEIACHGSRYILDRVLQLLIDNGCRMAQPGEFTKRAYLNGKMDLSQAEAVADLIAATNHATHAIALDQLKGHFSSELSDISQQIQRLTALLELEIDFSDHEDLEFADRTQLRELADKASRHILKLTKSFETGNALKKGIPVAIVGRTNVGKSTLLNRLLHEDRAIVSQIHGTTRDAIEDTTDINGITFRFIDTAGLRETDDEVENIGIGIAYRKMAQSRIVLWLTDSAPEDAEITEMLERCGNAHLVVVNNKIDIMPEVFTLPHFPQLPVIGISAKNGINIDSLEALLVKTADIPEINENDVILTSARHYDALVNAHRHLQHVMESMDMGLSGDLIAEDLKFVIDCINEITGSGQFITSQATLNAIFSEFCIGK